MPIKTYILLLIINLISCSSEKKAEDQINLESKSKTKVLFMDSAEILPDIGRPSSTLAVLVNDKVYVFNAGKFFLQRFALGHRAGLIKENITDVRNFFFTDLQSDLSEGIPDLIFIKMIVGSVKSTNIFGPLGSQAQLNKIMQEYTDGFTVEGFSLQPDVSDYNISLNVVSDGEVFSDNLISIDAFSVNRGDLKNSFGYKIKTPDKVLVVTGDISYSESVAENCDECDILIHSVFSIEGLNNISETLKEYQKKFHTSVQELAAIAAVSKPKLLILYNQLYYGISDEDLLKELGKYYKGDVVSAKAYDVF